MFVYSRMSYKMTWLFKYQRKTKKKKTKQNKKSENFDLIVQHIRCCYDDVRDGIPVYDDVAEMWNGKQNKWKSTILIY